MGRLRAHQVPAFGAGWRRRRVVALALAGFASVVAAVPADRALESGSPPPVLAAMQAELERSFARLGQEEEPPYYLSYEIHEQHSLTATVSFGQLVRRSESRQRQADVDLRVGSPELDNTHPRRGDGRRLSPPNRFAWVEVPLDDDPAAIASVLWAETDRRYKRAVEDLTAIATNVEVQVEASDTSPDFAGAPAAELIAEHGDVELDLDAWVEILERVTAPFADHGEIYRAEANLIAFAGRRWFVNTEGSRLATGRVAYRLSLSTLTKADDGMELPRYESFFSYSPSGLPDEETLTAVVADMVADLLALRQAPVVDPYTGPALLSGRAAGVFFHEVFGHRIEGHRQKSEEEGQTFKKMVGEPILPANFDVVFDPTRRRAGSTDLAGFYRFDNEGVASRPVTVIDDGVFRRFLMSRSPISGEPASNGHGRRQPGFNVVARQSNLLVEVAEPWSRDELKTELLRRVEAEGKPFGLYFEDIAGGFTLTGRRIPNAFNVVPIMVFRVYPDGHEELVRGVDLIGTPLTAFSAVVAGGGEPGVFNGTCGAESGGVPVAAISPSLLIGQVEVQKKEKSQERPPILPAPAGDAGEDG